MKKLLLLAALPIAMYSCTSETSSSSQSTTTTVDNAVDPNAKEVTINMYAGDDMKYNTRELRIKSGQKVTLTLEHTGTMHRSTMGHNFVLLQAVANVTDFANEAAKYHANDFIPEDKSLVIAHTKMLGGGQTDTITFEIMDPGVYPFLCTFTGHSAIMRGKLIVE